MGRVRKSGLARAQANNFERFEILREYGIFKDGRHLFVFILQDGFEVASSQKMNDYVSNNRCVRDAVIM